MFQDEDLDPVPSLPVLGDAPALGSHLHSPQERLRLFLERSPAYDQLGEHMSVPKRQLHTSIGSAYDDLGEHMRVPKGQSHTSIGIMTGANFAEAATSAYKHDEKNLGLKQLMNWANQLNTRHAKSLDVDLNKLKSMQLVHTAVKHNDIDTVIQRHRALQLWHAHADATQSADSTRTRSADSTRTRSADSTRAAEDCSSLGYKCRIETEDDHEISVCSRIQYKPDQRASWSASNAASR